jgi:hypothetical protein
VTLHLASQCSVIKKKLTLSNEDDNYVVKHKREITGPARLLEKQL